MDDVYEGKDFSFMAEEHVLKVWADLDSFHEQLRRTEGREEFIFYDGTPFSTGLPHYGHILTGTSRCAAATASPPSSRSRRPSASPNASRFSASATTTRLAAALSPSTSPIGRSSSRVPGGGSTSRMSTIPWTSTTWRASGGSSTCSGIRTSCTRVLRVAAILGFSMACSNTFGVVTSAFLLGFGSRF